MHPSFVCACVTVSCCLTAQPISSAWHPSEWGWGVVGVAGDKHWLPECSSLIRQNAHTETNRQNPNICIYDMRKTFLAYCYCEKNIAAVATPTATHWWMRDKWFNGWILPKAIGKRIFLFVMSKRFLRGCVVFQFKQTRPTLTSCLNINGVSFSSVNIRKWLTELEL